MPTPHLAPGLRALWLGAPGELAFAWLVEAPPTRRSPANSHRVGVDANGNLVSKSGDATYTWDFDDRLTRVVKADGRVVEHVYDVDGNRVRTTVTPVSGPAVVTEYLVDTTAGLSQVVLEQDGAGAVGAYYVRAGSELLAVRRGPVYATYLKDGLGSVRDLVDASGAVTDTRTYSAYGETLQSTGADAQPYGFAGEAFEGVSGLSYNRARWYDPRSGTFLGMDPVEGNHQYGYVGGNPVNIVDPSGRDYTLVDLGGVSSGVFESETVVAQAGGAAVHAIPLKTADVYYDGYQGGFFAQTDDPLRKCEVCNEGAASQAFDLAINQLRREAKIDPEQLRDSRSSPDLKTKRRGTIHVVFHVLFVYSRLLAPPDQQNDEAEDAQGVTHQLKGRSWVFMTGKYDLTQIDLGNVTKHEMVHLFGYDHNRLPLTLMYPVYTVGIDATLPLMKDEISTIRHFMMLPGIP